jgi:hypothetical protein
VCKTAQHSGIGHETNGILRLPYIAFRALRALAARGGTLLFCVAEFISEIAMTPRPSES